MESAISTNTTKSLSMPVSEFMDVVQKHVDGFAEEQEQRLLENHRTSWVAALLRLLDSASLSIESAKRKLKGRERSLVVADFEAEYARIDAVLTSLIGAPQKQVLSPPLESERKAPASARLQVSWQPGKIVVWASERGADAEDSETLQKRLHRMGAEAIDWKPFSDLQVPRQGKVDAFSAPVAECLGWIIALADTEEADVGVGAKWMGLLTSLAVRLVIKGRAVPQLRKHRKRRSDDLPAGSSKFEVRWSPALVSLKEFTDLTRSLPGSVAPFEDRIDKKGTAGVILNDLITAIFREAATRLDMASGGNHPTSKAELSEVFLSSLGGQLFVAPGHLGGDLARKLEQWSRSVSGTKKLRLVLQLDPPDDANAWYLSVLAQSSDRKLVPVEQVIVNSSNTRSKEVEDDLQRLERLYPELLRPGAKRRGEVLLSQDEAWHLMTNAGEILQAAGYEVRAPVLSRKKPTPALRLTSDEVQESVVGAQQLANVSWSVMFDDVELTSQEIRKLASEARPLVRSQGRWVELDKVDLAQAAAALEERADKSKLSGADMLRHALGLEGSSLSGGISIAGDGWAADLLRNASEISDHVVTKPAGFNGELRSYQAEACAWLGFLDAAGLGGCLALDMGLGKTPTMLAHLRLGKDSGPSLVIAPPAVVGNWAAEAKKFVSDVKVKIHHGPSRTPLSDIPALAEKTDVIITTYGTAVRDVSAFEKVEWSKVVLDEAQAIKNPSSETALQLRRISARTRVALTGTPIENGLGDLWAIMDYTNPGLVGSRSSFVAQLSSASASAEGTEQALRALNGILVFRRTKMEPAIAAELPDRIDELDRCAMTPEQIGLYQAVLDNLVRETSDEEKPKQKGAVLAAITALKQICNHPSAYQDDGGPLEGRSGKLSRLNEIIETVFASKERILIFTHFASWGEKLAQYLTEKHGQSIACYHGGLSRGARDRLVDDFQTGKGEGAMVVSLKAGGTGLNLTAANHVVLYDRWWNPAVEDQARDRVWRIGQKNTVVCHRLVCPGTVDERVEEVVAGKRQIADMVLPKSSSVNDLDSKQLQVALGIDSALLISDSDEVST